MKPSFILTTHDKNQLLPNVLTSIAKQKTSFKFEVCILDDASKESPEEIVDEFLPSTENMIVKFYRAEKNIGGRSSVGVAYRTMSDPGSDIFITMSADIILLQPFIIEELCKNVKSKLISSATIINSPVDPKFYENFNQNAKHCLKGWTKYTKFYSGPNRPGNWLFCSALTTQDFIDLHFDTYTCDRQRQFTLKENHISMKHLDYLKGIHQSHHTYRNKCEALLICKYRDCGDAPPCI